MTTNKERGFYWVVYICINCGKTITIDVPFGKTIPILTDIDQITKIPEMFREGYLESPECSNCGCKHWSRGKAKNG